jgi:excisionase family DNA binding protein
MSNQPELPIENVVNTRLLNGDDVARILNISKAFAYQLMRQGEIRTVRMGRAVRVRMEDLTQYIAQSTC